MVVELWLKCCTVKSIYANTRDNCKGGMVESKLRTGDRDTIQTVLSSQLCLERFTTTPAHYTNVNMYTREEP